MTEQERARLEGQATRTDRVVSWIGWHVGELVAVGVPLLLAATVSVWLAVVSVLAGAAWGVHEFRHARQQRAIRAETEQRRHLAAAEQTSDDTNGTDGGDGTTGTGASA
ncbi:hypothetical protein B0I33_1133 [Prauserella shujinwangii]|uniref:Uncharacterized protein n=1 Tax=Prauserella shujinwangii TaxID=1453103 RepID=A0A2T0LLJ6_9PSEU|nr:hypothetical protein [Prauserella shujinwangii]PRX43840.1 hypothetical protein B0I33_1133 [Prauserella shujinwangii]